MPYENLTQELTEEVQNQVLAAIQSSFDSLSGNLVNLTTDDIAGTYKMNQNRQSLGSRSIQMAQQNTQFVPTYLSTAAASTDMDRFTRLVGIEAQLQALLTSVRHARMASGGEVMLFVRGFYASLKAAAEQNAPGAVGLYNELKVYYDLPERPDGGDGTV